MANNKILVVDDDRDTLDVIKIMLESRGWTVFTAEGAEQAFKLFDKERPFLLMADLRLHDIVDGATLAGKCKFLDPFLICIAITGYLTAFDVGYLLGSIFTDILPKPIARDLLFQVVDYAADKAERWRKILI